MTRLLLVEDDDAIADPLVEGLGREGFDVDRVGTGTAALERYAAGGRGSSSSTRRSPRRSRGVPGGLHLRGVASAAMAVAMHDGEI